MNTYEQLENNIFKINNIKLNNKFLFVNVIHPNIKGDITMKNVLDDNILCVFNDMIMIESNEFAAEEHINVQFYANDEIIDLDDYVIKNADDALIICKLQLFIS